MATSGEFEIVTEGTTAKSASPMSAKDEEEVVLRAKLPAKGGGGSLAVSPPTLNIANNGDMLDLEQNLKEVIREIEKSPVMESESSGTLRGWGGKQCPVH